MVVAIFFVPLVFLFNVDLATGFAATLRFAAAFFVAGLDAAVFLTAGVAAVAGLAAGATGICSVSVFSATAVLEAGRSETLVADAAAA
ncbi:hypothetical protein [Parasphingorhabdus sp.]|uniref:hypothetical protein n=1 Tax=Parasphingorhabdus sp. TaxID=2709688 RepID=UPI003A8CD565